MMWDWLDSASYMAHGYCLLWEPWLVLLYAGSDALIFLAYALIPVALWRFLRLRPGLGYGHLVALFAAFILLCGLTHLISIVTLWYAVYALHGVAKLATAGVSLATAAVLFPLVPVIARIPSPGQLQEANARLTAEIAAHERTLAELEVRVEARTAELSAANAQLAVVNREMVHRSKNLLSVVQSLARQSARGARDKDDLVVRLGGRLAALASANDSVLRSGAGGKADLGAVAQSQIAAHAEAFAGRITLDGPPVLLPAEAAQNVALALHELATNAVKHGALSRPAGEVALAWSAGPAGEVVLDWRERWPEQDAGGAAAAGGGRGFGSLLLTEAIPRLLGGQAERAFDTGGMRYRLAFPAADAA
jgi:two-component sensor histidine kinase